MKQLPVMRRRTVDFSDNANLVKVSSLAPDSVLPAVIEPALEDLDLEAWARSHRQFIETTLAKHGAILFRNFRVTEDSFARCVCGIADELMDHNEESSPRSQVDGNVYTSTDYPPNQSIFPHNEGSYVVTFAMKLFFFCAQPPTTGGATPLASTRRVVTHLSERTIRKFEKKHWMYIRNYGEGMSLPWQKVFQTEDKKVVECYCRTQGITCEWKPGNRMRTRQVRPAFVIHPRSGEKVWFNHITFFHVSTLPKDVADALTSQFGHDDLPNNTCYGDGEPIEPAVLDELREAYLRENVRFSWQQGDLVLVDNVLVSHARDPFTGPRRILFAMAEPCTRTDIRF